MRGDAWGLVCVNDWGGACEGGAWRLHCSGDAGNGRGFAGGTASPLAPPARAFGACCGHALVRRRGGMVTGRAPGKVLCDVENGRVQEGQGARGHGRLRRVTWIALFLAGATRVCGMVGARAAPLAGLEMSVPAAAAVRGRSARQVGLKCRTCNPQKIPPDGTRGALGGARLFYQEAVHAKGPIASADE